MMNGIATITETTSFFAGANEGVGRRGRLVKQGRRVIFAEGDIMGRRTDRVIARPLRLCGVAAVTFSPWFPRSCNTDYLYPVP